MASLPQRADSGNHARDVTGVTVWSVGGMSLRIEYFRAGEKVMVAVFLKHESHAKHEAVQGLVRFGADMAQIRDMDHGGKMVCVVTRDG